MIESIFKSSEIKEHLFQLCCAIAELQGDDHGRWLSSREIAKYQHGSEELAPLVESLIDAPGADFYLVKSVKGRRVNLTEQGRAFIQSPAVQTETAQITLSQQAAGAVKAYARGIRLLHYNIQSIQTIGKATKRYVHAIKVDLGDALLPNESPAHVVSEALGRRIHGRIVGQDVQNGILYVALDSSISAADLPARLEIDRAFLLYQLADAISHLEDIPPLGHAMFSQARPQGFNIQHNDSGIVADQLAALQPPWTHFLWGPPGAGKTYGMARLMLRLLESDPTQRILLVAPSNIAVDVALDQFVELVEESSLDHLVLERRILRYGYPQKKAILSRPELLGSAAQQTLSQDIGRKERELSKATKADEPEEDLSLLRADLLDLQEQLKGLVHSHASACNVVATTTTMAYLKGGPIASQNWDTVLVDEVTMVPPAVCLYLSSLAGSQLLFAGDPRQLGPIYESQGKEKEAGNKWMGQDIYNFSGLAAGKGEKRDIQTQDPRLVRITSQRRCTEAIWQPIRHMYRGVERSVDESALQYLHFLPPDRGRPLVMIDTARALQNAHCERHRKSWQNPKTAAFAANMAREIIEALAVAGRQASISIITPYRAQYRLIQQNLKEIELHQQVEVGTIHRFQGSEADVVIFDLVDGPGRKELGALLVGDGGLRLLNVAISRARGKLIVLADKSWCRQVMQRKDNPLLWDLIRERHKPARTRQPALARPTRPVTAAPVEALSYPPPPPVPVEKEHDPPSLPSATPEKPVQKTESPILTVTNISPEIINALAAGDYALIENKAAKRKLNQTLSDMRLTSFYDEEEHVTSWLGSHDELIVVHKEAMLCRLT